MIVEKLKHQISSFYAIGFSVRACVYVTDLIVHEHLYDDAQNHRINHLLTHTVKNI